jgi:hypothetical protein
VRAESDPADGDGVQHVQNDAQREADRQAWLRRVQEVR